METGGQCVMMSGLQWMPMWLVDSLDTLVLVCKENMFVHNVHDDCMHVLLTAQIQLFILAHTLEKTVLSS